jgi:hypothetical protein
MMKTKMENSGLNKETRSPGGNRFMASWVPYKKISTEGNKVGNSGLNKETRSPGGNRFMASWVPYKKVPADNNAVIESFNILPPD